MPIVFVRQRDAEKWVKKNKEEWTQYKVHEVDVRVFSDSEGAVGEQLVRIIPPTDIKLNPYAATLLAESLLHSPDAMKTVGDPYVVLVPVQRKDCPGKWGVRITLEALTEQPDTDVDEEAK